MSRFPELMKLQKEFRNTTLLEYVNTHILKERELLPLDMEAYEIFCKNFSQKHVRTISTGSHMGFLQWEDAFDLGENILANLPSLLNGGESTITAPCSRVSFKDASRPGAIDLSGMGQNSISLSRYTLRGQSKTTINKAQMITSEEMENFLHSFYKFQKQPQMFKFIDQDKLTIFIAHAQEMVSRGQTFNEQSSWLSSQLWPHLFRDMKTSPLIMKPLEDLQIKRENLLANREMRALLEEHFKDSYGAMSSTYFYYGSCKCGIEFPLTKREDGGLVFLEGNCQDKNCPHYGKEKYSVEVNDVIEEVKRGNLNESLFMAFYNIWILAGIDVLGGFNQVQYLKDFKDKLCIIFDRMGERRKSEIVQNRASNLLDLSPFICFNQNGSPQNGAQIFLSGGLDKEYLERFSSLKFSLPIEASMQAIYSLFYGETPDHALTLKILKDNNMGFMIK
ncbi:MAG: hypothetical protein JXA52_03780 [Planctomycetes bacterium]|nr:hypothetical protein [Planctomycetota bacterium]